MVSSTQALSIEKNPNLHDVSFSSYLNPPEEVFRRKPVEADKSQNSILAIQKENTISGKNKIEDGEIDVFGAEKYFNGGIDVATNHQPMKNHQIILNPSKVKTQARTPSVHSQSSWNSQNALLQSGRKNSIHNKNAKRRQGKNIFSTLSCNCSCGDTNSIDIGEQKSESFSKRNFREDIDLDQTIKSLMNPKIMEEMQMKKIEDFGIMKKKEECFSFPIANPKKEIFETKLALEKDELENKRKSLEVFARFPIFLERKIDLFTLNTDPTKDSDKICDDFESDASSDLFEIESFSTNNNSNPNFVRQATNVSSGAIPTICYAPSEASVEWSVVTESAADFSFISDSEYKKSTFKAGGNPRKTTKNVKGKEVEKRYSGILSGCKSQKAVMVVGDAYRTNKKVVFDTRGNYKSDTNPIF